MSQSDFWKPAPFDFEAVLAVVDFGQIVAPHEHRAKAHAIMPENLSSPGRTARDNWAALERHHDTYDTAYFTRNGMVRDVDVWDNRKKQTA
jgi:hypothetical protein